MPEHDPAHEAELDSHGEKVWGFHMLYLLPEQPTDGRDWFNAISTTDESVHAHDNETDVHGSAWVKDNTIRFWMKSSGQYSSAHFAAMSLVHLALKQGSLGESQLLGVEYIDPDVLIESPDPPF